MEMGNEQNGAPKLSLIKVNGSAEFIYPAFDSIKVGRLHHFVVVCNRRFAIVVGARQLNCSLRFIDIKTSFVSFRLVWIEQTNEFP